MQQQSLNSDTVKLILIDGDENNENNSDNGDIIIIPFIIIMSLSSLFRHIYFD